MFYNNTAVSGGAIYSNSAFLRLSANNFTQNKAEIGGALNFLHNLALSKTDFETLCGLDGNNTCESNTATIFGKNYAHFIQKFKITFAEEVEF